MDKQSFNPFEDDGDDENDDDEGDAEDEGFEVERILATCYGDPKEKGERGLYSQVRWKNYGLEEGSWKPLSEECMDQLAKKPSQSVVYISFGSMVSLIEERMEEIDWGLKESNLHFLWVVRYSKQKKLPKWFVDSTKEKGMVVIWCNQLETLAHPIIGCFMTNC